LCGLGTFIEEEEEEEEEVMNLRTRSMCCFFGFLLGFWEMSIF
jgi:hypothetical protein